MSDTNDRELVLKEYETSKESIRSVMTQLVVVSTSLLAFSLTLLRLPGSAGAFTSSQFLYLVLIALNFMIAFTAYQNVQIQGLQRHIQRLERALMMPSIFCWESTIARVWYSDHPVALLFNACLVIPPGALVFSAYKELYSLVQAGSISPIVFVGNLVYLAMVIFCYRYITNRVDQVVAIG